MSASSSAPPWYADGLRFACTQCGNCCSGAPGYVWVNREEALAISAHLGLSLSDFTSRHLRRVGRAHSLLELADGDCEFLERLDDGTTRCRIHAVRPVQCRTWPFWKSNLTTHRAWQLTAKGCPGIGDGKLHEVSEIETALKENGQRPL